MNENKIIENKVNEFINNSELFTSIDISNAIKRDSIWIRNKKVSEFLKNFDFNNVSYSKKLIDVVNYNKNKKAYVYFPDYSDVSFYTKTNQSTISKKTLPNTQLKIVPQTINKIYKIKCNSKKIKIPAKIVSFFKNKIGSIFDINNIDTSNFNKISNKIKVNKDGRINIMKSYVNLTSNIISIYIENNKIKIGDYL